MARDLVFEIGVEELPSGPLYGAIEQLQVVGAQGARRRPARVRHGHASSGSPRRLVVQVVRTRRGAGRRDPHPKGPSAKAAFAEDGNPTRPPMGSRAARACPSSR